MSVMADPRARSTCSTCSTPIDSLHFDAARFVAEPQAGELVVIVRHELPRQYCGLFEGFQQFDSRSLTRTVVETPWIEWAIRVNGRPLDPYMPFTFLLNPWGEPVHRLAIALEEGTVIEMVARGLRAPGEPEERRQGRIGGRLMGRYWFDGPGRPR